MGHVATGVAAGVGVIVALGAGIGASELFERPFNNRKDREERDARNDLTEQVEVYISRYK